MNLDEKHLVMFYHIVMIFWRRRRRYFYYAKWNRRQNLQFLSNIDFIYYNLIFVCKN